MSLDPAQVVIHSVILSQDAGAVVVNCGSQAARLSWGPSLIVPRANRWWLAGQGLHIQLAVMKFHPKSTVLPYALPASGIHAHVQPVDNLRHQKKKKSPYGLLKLTSLFVYMPLSPTGHEFLKDIFSPSWCSTRCGPVMKLNKHA